MAYLGKQSLRYDSFTMQNITDIKASRHSHPVAGGLTLRAVIGFACNQGFVFSLFYMGANRALSEGPLLFERVDLLVTLLFMVAAFAVLRIASAKARLALFAPGLVWCYAALLVLGSIIPTLLGSTSLPLMILEGGLLGFPAGLLLAAWGHALGLRSIAGAVPAVFVGAALGAALCFFVALIPFEGALVALKLLPLGSAWGLGVTKVLFAPNAQAGALPVGSEEVKMPREKQGVEYKDTSLSLRVLLATPSERAQTARLSLKMMSGTVLFGLAAGFMETYGSDPGMASTPTFPATLLLLVVFCLAALQLFASNQSTGMFKRNNAAASRVSEVSPSGVQTLRESPATSTEASEPEGPLDGVYRLAALVMMAGFLFVPVLSDFGVPGEAIVLAGYLGLSSLLISLFLVMAHITGQDASLSFARGFSALFIGEILGIVLGNVIDLAAGSEQTPYVVVACAALAVLFAFLFLFTERDFRSLSIIVRDAGCFEEACALIVFEYGLSKREAEILPFALKGRTTERIAAEFSISKSTVDTHVRRIYTKCAVHSRQELIDLGEGAQRRPAGS